MTAFPTRSSALVRPWLQRGLILLALTLAGQTAPAPGQVRSSSARRKPAQRRHERGKRRRRNPRSRSSRSFRFVRLIGVRSHK